MATWVTRRRRALLRGVGIGCLLVAALPGPAFADSPVLPPGDSLPWSDPAHQSPLEQFGSGIASQIAGRQVRVLCAGQGDWDGLGRSRETDLSNIGGFVDTRYWVGTRTIVDSATGTWLSPNACTYLWQYGKAEAKPTKCPTVIRQPKTVTETVQVPKKVKVRVKVKGKWKTIVKTVMTTKQVSRDVLETVPGPAAPCYTGGASTAVTEVGSDYYRYAQSLMTLAHESIHLLDFRAGASIDQPFEARAECFALQWLPWVATQFGTTPDDGRALANYSWTVIYPRYQGVSHNGDPYWSPDCVQNGPLDLSPGDGLWP